jgi:hypothetical protein
MSALGQKRTCAAQQPTSALPLKADICSALADVGQVPEADTGLHLIGKPLRRRALCTVN